MIEDKSYLSLKGDTNYWLKHLQLLNNGRVAILLSKKDKEIERLNKTIQIARNNILSDISMIKNEKMSKKELINRLQSTLSLIVGSDKE